MATSCQVRVGVRIRPLTATEESQGGKNVVEALPNSRSVKLGKRRFTYDTVFHPDMMQEELYERESPSLIGSFLDGYNSTIIAYGQTGSGKTYTMGSEAHSMSDYEDGLSTQQGLIPRFLNDVFNNLHDMKEASKQHVGSGCNNEENHNQNTMSSIGTSNLVDYSVTASFLEVYGDDVHDLLAEQRKPLELRENIKEGVVVPGLQNKPVKTLQDALKVLQVGTQNRTTAATLMNLTSSRSHAVFSVNLSQTRRGHGNVDVSTCSRFTFVDLAGSERMKKTGAEGERAREGIKINEGLLALGNVINALADDERLAKKERAQFIPYRQSKLTRLLQDALGGNSQTFFIACVSPSDTNASETLSTLHYANRARNIKNAPTKNVASAALELQQLHAFNFILQCELVKARFFNDSKGNGAGELGKLNDDVLERKDVQEFIGRLRQIADQQQEHEDLAKPTSTRKRVAAVDQTTSEEQHSESVANKAKRRGMSQETGGSEWNMTVIRQLQASLADVNPDEEMSILSQLLEVQHRNQEYDKKRQIGKRQIELVEHELKSQEKMLLQLRSSLKVYHDMKSKYEGFLGEVRSLEAEKKNLSELLQATLNNTSKGTSHQGIRQALRQVEHNLTRARKQSKEYQHLYRQAEQEAQRCRGMEHKIAELKQEKASLAKKQREAVAKHREIIEQKTRELKALKQRERNANLQVSKLEAQCQRQKATNERRKADSMKMAEKLKQAESDLLNVLSMKKRDLRPRVRWSRTLGSTKKHGTIDTALLHDSDSDLFATSTNEISSVRYLLEKMVAERVEQSEVKVRYEDLVGQNGDLMKKLMEEVKSFKVAQQALAALNEHDDKYSAIQEEIHEHGRNVQELELRHELVSSELEDLRSMLPGISDNESVSTTDSVHTADPEASTEEVAKKMVATLNVKETRTLLWDLLDTCSDSEFERRKLGESNMRKDKALDGLDFEVGELKKTIGDLSNEIAQRRQIPTETEEALERARALERENASLKRQLELKKQQLEQMADDLKAEQARAQKRELEVCASTEAKTSQEPESSKNGPLSTTGIIDKSLLHACLGRVYSQKLQEALAKRIDKENKISKAKENLKKIFAALGLLEESEKLIDEQSFAGLSLPMQTQRLEEIKKGVLSRYSMASEKKRQLLEQVRVLLNAVGRSNANLSGCLSQLLDQKGSSFEISGFPLTTERKAENSEGRLNCIVSFFVPDNLKSRDLADIVVVDAKDSLSDEFLAECGKEIEALEIMKAEMLFSNSMKQEEAISIMRDLDLSQGDILGVCFRSAECSGEFPEWWNPAMALKVCKAMSKDDGTVEGTEAFTQHLSLIHSSLIGLSMRHRKLSVDMDSECSRKTKLLQTGTGVGSAEMARSPYENELFGESLFSPTTTAEDPTMLAWNG